MTHKQAYELGQEFVDKNLGRLRAILGHLDPVEYRREALVWVLQHDALGVFFTLGMIALTQPDQPRRA